MTKKFDIKRPSRHALLAVVGTIGVTAHAGPAAAQTHVGFCIVSDTPIWVPPRYETRERIITLPPLYEEVSRRVWREPVYRIKRRGCRVSAERVRRGGRHGRGLSHRTPRRVMRPNRRACREKRILVRPGHWGTLVERVLIRPARTKVIHERVLVREGHWAEPPCRITKKSRPYRHTTKLTGGIGYRHDGFRVSVGLER